jgi:hypothetical protein
MKTRIGTLAVLTAALALAPAAQAAPTKVKVRVEGATKTLFEGAVTTDAHPVDGGDGSGPHVCDGTNGGANTTPGPTATGALDDAVKRAHLAFNASWSDDFQDFLVNKIGPDATANGNYWTVAVNRVPASVGGCQTVVGRGEEVLFYYGNGTATRLLRSSGRTRARAGQKVRLKVTATTLDKNGAATAKNVPVKGARIAGKRTNRHGIAIVRFSRPGVKRLKAQQRGAIRSNQLTVKIR